MKVRLHVERAKGPLQPKAQSPKPYTQGPISPKDSLRACGGSGPWTPLRESLFCKVWGSPKGSCVVLFWVVMPVDKGCESTTQLRAT